MQAESLVMQAESLVMQAESLVMQAESLVEDLIEEEFEGIELRSYAEKQLFKHHQFEQLAAAMEKRAKRRLWIGAAITLAAVALGISSFAVGPGRVPC